MTEDCEGPSKKPQRSTRTDYSAAVSIPQNQESDHDDVDADPNDGDQDVDDSD
jgi:hypothetical protein